MVFMTQARPARLSVTQKSEVWRRWKAGQSLHLDFGLAKVAPSTAGFGAATVTAPVDDELMTSPGAAVGTVA